MYTTKYVRELVAQGHCRHAADVLRTLRGPFTSDDVPIVTHLCRKGRGDAVRHMFYRSDDDVRADLKAAVRKEYRAQQAVFVRKGITLAVAAAVAIAFPNAWMIPSLHDCSIADTLPLAFITGAVVFGGRWKAAEEELLNLECEAKILT